VKRGLWGVGAGLLAAAALALAATPARAAGPLVPCAANGLLCGDIPVPLDRSGGTPGTLSLYVEELPPQGFSRGVMFLLAGGPGQASAETFDLAHRSAFWQSIFPGYALVAYDDRGTGRSGALDCNGTLSVAGCAEAIGPTRTFYATRDHAEDLESVREALGFDRIGLYGGSYGTKQALAYALAHPDRVERLVLDSVLPPEGPDPLGTSLLRAIPLAIDSICHDKSCRAVSRNPAGDFARLANRNGGSDALLELMIDSDIDIGVGPELPSAVRAALAGNPLQLTRLLSLDQSWVTPLLSDINVGLELATACNDGPFPWSPSASTSERVAAIESASGQLPETSLGPFGSWATDVGNAWTCVNWPAPTGEAPLAAGPLPNVPVLVLEGDRDVRTPLAGGMEVASQFPQGRVLVVHGAGHSVLKRTPCAADAVRTWLDGGTPPPSCARLPSAPPVVSFPASVAAARPLGGPGRVGKTLAVAVATLQEAEAAFAFLDNVAQVPGIQDGALAPAVARTSKLGRVRLDGYSDVSGLTLSGAVACKPAGDVFPESFTCLPGSLQGTLRVGGSGSAHGMLRLGDGAIAGTLGGRPVSASV
jgi:pimeloyl-ACP methyl ester carboxylesterase